MGLTPCGDYPVRQSLPKAVSVGLIRKEIVGLSKKRPVSHDRERKLLDILMNTTLCVLFATIINLKL